MCVTVSHAPQVNTTLLFTYAQRTSDDTHVQTPIQRVTLAVQTETHTSQASRRRQCHPYAEKKKRVSECQLVILY